MIFASGEACQSSIWGAVYQWRIYLRNGTKQKKKLV